MKNLTLFLASIILLLLTSCGDSNESSLNESPAIKITFQRTIISDYNSDINGVDSTVVLIDKDLIMQSNFYDPEFTITELKKGVRTQYYPDFFETKAFYPLIDTTKYKIEDSKESKKILGYTCKKRVFTSDRDTITAYFTNELNFTFSYLPNLKIDGCILEIKIKDRTDTETWKAVIVDKETKETIKIPSDYEDDESKEYKAQYFQNYKKLEARSGVVKQGDIAPYFSAKSLTNEEIELNKLKGKVVVMNFWDIVCTGCVAEMPDLNKLVAEFKGEDIEFISVTDDTRNALYKFLRRKKFDFKILPNTAAMFTLFGVEGMPSTIVIDKNGKIAKTYYFQLIHPNKEYDNLVQFLKSELEK